MLWPAGMLKRIGFLIFAIVSSSRASVPAVAVNVRTPKGAQSGSQLRVKGKGIPGEPMGDLYLEIQIVVPQATTQEAIKLYETMAQELAFDPRADLKGQPS